MEDELIDGDRLSLSRKSVLPGAGFFYPDSLDEEYAERRTKEAVEGAEVVVIADSDADGLGCVALIREAYDAALDAASFEESIAERLAGDELLGGPDAGSGSGGTDEEDGSDGERGGGEADDEGGEEPAEPDSPVALVGAGPHSLPDALERVAEYADPGADAYVCDLSPDRYEDVGESLEALVRRASRVRWFDHHQWDDEVAAAVRGAGVDLVVGDSDEECSTDVTLRSLDYDFDDRFRELAAVTRDHDLWLREDPRSDDLADYAYWADPEEYVTIVGRYGADLPEPVEEYVAARRVEKEQLVERAVERAEMKAVGPWTVGVTYGRCSQNEVAEALRERGSDAAVIVKPAGSASIRGSDGFERCHEVAAQVNGGGHPKAAGCKPGIYDDMLDYAHHWTTQGSAAKRVILAAFERLAEDETAEGEIEADEDDGDGDEDTEGIETDR
ncbi:DHH family phosphoesterase [Halegenticoccus soli]|uniref:DHH family phosphoesterase n=1 Tax=Halegenticoccus soli TaxID=1985678 RepID=UPI000C6EC10B|nr:phosphohydrolase [Halegenticoccus soli]